MSGVFSTSSEGNLILSSDSNITLCVGGNFIAIQSFATSPFILGYRISSGEF